MMEDKKEVDKVILTGAELSKYFGKEITPREYGMTPVICEKGYRNHPLTEVQKTDNREKSKVRSRVEHVFGFKRDSSRRGRNSSKSIRHSRADKGLPRSDKAD